MMVFLAKLVLLGVAYLLIATFGAMAAKRVKGDPISSGQLMIFLSGIATLIIGGFL